MAERWEKLGSVVVSGAALVIALAVVRREFFAETPPERNRGKTEYIADWQKIVAAGRVKGNPEAPIKLIEFADLECPFCRQYNATIDRVLREHPNDVAFVFIHFPLPNHRFAGIASRAAECAQTGGAFWSMIDALYAKQDSFGLKSWSSFAVQAGIRDTVSFERCVRASEPVEAIQKGLALGKSIGVGGTPSVMLNGWLMPAAPSDTHLTRVIRDVRAGRNPYPGASQ